MTYLDIEVIKRDVDEDLWPLIPALLEGLSKDQIEAGICEIRGFAPNSSQATIARMNFAGGLRAAGWVVTGGRSGGNVYRIVGFEEKTYRTPVTEWQGDLRETHDWVLQLRRLSDQRHSIVRRELSKRSPNDGYHENCWLYPFGYEAARDSGWFYDPNGQSMIILRRHRWTPRFRLFALASDAQTLLNVAEELAKISTHTVSIINPDPRIMDDLKRLDPKGSWSRREEAVYDVVDIATNPGKYLNSRAQTTQRKLSRECLMIETYNDCDGVLDRAEDHLAVIRRWQEVNEEKHRQLAIERDRKSVRCRYPHRIAFLTYREGVPVAHHLFDPLPNRADMVALINEKSLNYRQAPDGSTIEGGAPGISDFNQIQACQRLAEKGYLYIQSGGIDGGGDGLPHKKMKYTVATVSSSTFYTSFAPGAPK